MVVANPRRPAARRQPVEPWVEEPRVDLRDKVTGRTQYVDDLPPLAGMAYAAGVRSPYSHARIRSIDSSRARALPGVLAVLDRDHLDGLDPTIPIGEYVEEAEGRNRGDQGLVATEVARFDGDLVAMVVAEDLRTARRAARLVDVDYEVLKPVFSYDEALAPGAPLVHEELGTNVALEDILEWGDVDQGFREADHVFQERFFGPSIFHHPMEPATSCVTAWVGDEVTLWASVHKPFLIAPQVAHVLGVPAENVRVRVPPVGGGFGAKQFTPAIMGAMELSRRIGRPVKYLATEDESFRATSRHSIAYVAKVGVKHDGTLAALDVFLEVDTGAYFTGASLVTHNACISAWGCYRIPHFRVRAKTVFTNKVPAASFRATGKNQTTFGVECTLDSAARQIGVSPIEMRKKNALRRGEYITETWKGRGVEYPADTPPMDTDYAELLDKAVQAIGWDGRGNPDSLERPRTGVVRGHGLALSLRHGAQGGGRAYAMVTVDRTGTVRVLHNAPDLGTGVFNMLRVVAAKALGVPQSDVVVGLPDTSNNITFGGTSAQRTTVQMGNAVRSACENLKQDLIEAAIQTKGGSAEDWRLGGGKLWRGDQGFTFKQIVGSFKGNIVLKAVGSYSYAPSVDRVFGGLDHWAPGASAAEVEVDLDTGEVKLLRYAGVADAGKALHYTSAVRQVEGGAILGFGGAMSEELIYREGQLLNADPFQYRMPVMADLPEAFTSILVENGDGPGPHGAKGMSQTSLPCMAPAVGSAIRDAIGEWVRETPFTPERVLRVLGKLPER